MLFIYVVYMPLLLYLAYTLFNVLKHLYADICYIPRYVLVGKIVLARLCIM